MAEPTFNRTYSVAEYFQLEAEEKGAKYEFVDGHIYAMAGGTIKHGMLISNALYWIREGIRKLQSLQQPTHLMKIISYFLGFLLLGMAYLSAQINPDFHPIVQAAKESSLYTQQVDWQVVNKGFQELAEGASGVEEMKPALQYLINSLGDKHASFRNANDYSIVVSYTGDWSGEDTRERDGALMRNVINDITAECSYQLLRGQVGYVRIVGIGPGNVQAQAQVIRDALLALKEKKVNHWIVDLRFNGGGNMEPMLAGLAPLVGEGKIGGAITLQGEITREYWIEGGQFNNHGRIVCEMKEEPVIDPEEKVAVLLSRYTVSSGEVVAVAFKGRPHTRFFGEASGGFTTGNGFQQVSDELIMLISEDVFMDRNGNRYDQAVEVDEYLEFEYHEEMASDPQVLKAMEWLKE